MEETEFSTLVEVLKQHIRQRLSPRHVPSLFLQVPDIPYTVNGKKAEVVIKKLFAGTHDPSILMASLAHPELLTVYVDLFRAHPAA